jgi:excisionase family DNA binding protein
LKNTTWNVRDVTLLGAIGQQQRGFTNAARRSLDRSTGGNMQGQPENDALLTPSEVAAMFRVNPKTVTRWARAGKISAIRTLGGHRRFRASEIRRFLEQVEEHEEA